jgi:tetratricopeptide (TPR) repeat protein
MKNKIIIFCEYLAVFLLSGCALNANIKDAKSLALESDRYFQQSVQRYKELISIKPNNGNQRYELGLLYYQHGQFDKAVEELKNIELPWAKKFLAISFYRLGNFVDALEIFHKQQLEDDEYLYFYGLTCEKLNLFDQALGIYKKIKSKEFSGLSVDRAWRIEKQINSPDMQELDPKVFDIIKNAPDSENYPQAAGLVLFCDEKIEISPQDTQIFYLHYMVKILNERGKDVYSEAAIDYDSTFEKVELEYARTIKPDGKVAEVGSRHIRDVSKYMNFPLYSNARVFIISFPEICEGAVVEYKLKVRRNRLMNKKDTILSYPLQALDPIILENFVIELPAGKKLNMKFLNEEYNDFKAQLNPSIRDAGSVKIYSWQFKDLPQIIPESNMPPDVKINPTIILSTFQTWQEIYDWWWDLAKDKISADSSIKEKVRELIGQAKDPQTKARAIYNFCAQKIRYVAVEYGQAGHEPHQAADIFKNKYGDCKDQAILLVTMLKEAGLVAWPVLISTKDYYNLNEDFPTAMFNHCIASVLIEGEIVFLDPTAETCSFGDLPPADYDRKVLVIKEDGFAIKNTPLYPASHNLSQQYFKVKVNQDETIDVEKTIYTQGVYQQGQRYWLLYTPPELIGQQLQEKIQEVSIGAKLDGYRAKNASDLDKPVSLSYNFKGPEYFTSAGLLRIMPQLSVIDRKLVSREKRRYPIELEFLDSLETDFEFIMPEDLAVKYMPDNISEDNPWLALKVEYGQKGNAIYFKQRAQFKKDTITQGEYPDFKKSFEELSKKIKQRIVLEKLKK